MTKNKKITLIATLALIGAIGVGSTFAYFTDTAEATNTVTFGHVEISIDEPEFKAENNGTEIKNVVPGQTIEKDPVITVLKGSEDAYLRAKIEYDGLTEEQIKGLEFNFADGWTKTPDADGYYYYKDAVSEETDVPFFTAVKIPGSWDNSMADESFDIIVKAEAVQAEAFEVDDDGVWQDTSFDVKAYK